MMNNIFLIKTYWMMEIDSEKYGNLSQKSEFEFTFFTKRHPRLISIFRGCPKTKKRILNNIWSISLIHCSWVYCS